MVHRIVLVTVLGIFCQAPGQAGDPDLLHIGIVDSLVKDLSRGQQKIVEAEFTKMVLDYTGLKSQVLQGGGPLGAAEKLGGKQWHFGVFQGIEFAWAQAKDPKLQPLLLALNRHAAIHALLVVSKDNTATGFAALKGKDVTMLRAREHCRLFADKGGQGHAQKYFGSLVLTENGEAALDEVILGKYQAAIVDQITLELYKEVHPGRFNRLKILVQSEAFPSTVIAVHQGTLSAELLQKFQAGILKLNQSDQGREVMSTFRITSFERVPATYPRMLADILKAYPRP